MDSVERRRKKNTRFSNISFSATLPANVRGVYADSICAVKFSGDPFVDFQESIVEMIRDVGVHNWAEMEELVYCYVLLNSPEIHGLIGDAFISLCCSHHFCF